MALDQGSVAVLLGFACGRPSRALDARYVRFIGTLIRTLSEDDLNSGQSVGAISLRSMLILGERRSWIDSTSFSKNFKVLKATADGLSTQKEPDIDLLVP